MSTTGPAAHATTALGALEGRWNEGVAAFRGVPYALPPVGSRRWAPPEAASPWSGVRTAHEAGPIPPQHPARLTGAMGPMRAPAPGEDCLTLNVWAPTGDPDASLPVLVYLHGGGYLAGAGSAEWFDGAALARRGPAVVVTVNYRLGALGYLFLPPSVTGGAPVANLGLQDQALALEWIGANARAFGGDPANITVFGQSGGGHSILGLLALGGRAPALIRRAILQSAPLGMPAADPAAAEAITRIFLEEAGVPDGDLDDLRALPLDRIMEAQRAVVARTAAPGRLEPPFHLVVDGTTLERQPIDARLLDGVDVMLGFTADEARAFLAFDDALWQVDAATLLDRVAGQQGPEARARLARYVDHDPDRPAAAALADLVSDRMFVAPAVRWADRRAADGRATHVYRMDWHPAGGATRLRACHTIELPFVFGTIDAWTEAPMLAGAAPAALEALADRVQAAWLGFATSGDPSRPDLPWPPYDAQATTTMSFDEASRAVDDPAHGRRALWNG